MKVDIREAPERVMAITKRLGKDKVQIVQLPVSDYCTDDQSTVGVEWKGDDFLGSLTSGTLFQQVHELNENFDYSLLIVEKNFDDLVRESSLKPAALIGTVASLIARGVIPIFLSNRDLAMDVMVRSFDKLTDGKDRSMNTSMRPRGKVVKKKGRPEPKLRDYQMSVLIGLPNMSGVRAKEIIAHFGSIKAFVNAEPDEVRKIKGIDAMALKWHEVLTKESDEQIAMEQMDEKETEEVDFEDW